jgi:two-component system response regulator LytT
MEKAKIIIIEDEFFAAAHLKELVSALGLCVVNTYHSGEDFLKETDWNFDAAIVDIFLSGKLTGLDIAQKMKERKKPFVFLTANRDNHTLKEAARLGPAAYISKPFQPNDVTAALEIIVHSLPKMIAIRTHHGIEGINPNDITYIKSDGVYIEIHTNNKHFTQRKLLKEIESELPSSFIRVHRSYLVNTFYVEQRWANHLVVNGHEIPISRGFKPNLSLFF